MLCLPVDVVGVVCSFMRKRSDVINLLFRTCRELRVKHWERVLSSLPLFRACFSLRSEGESAVDFYRAVSSLKFFAECVFLDNAAREDVSSVFKHPVVFSSFLRFSGQNAFVVFGKATRSNSLVPSNFQHLHRATLRAPKWSWDKLAMVSSEEIDEWRLVLPLQVVIVEELSKETFVLPAFAVRTRLCIAAPHVRNSMMDQSHRPLFLQKHHRFETSMTWRYRADYDDEE
jgi:hypothetical protein